MPTKVYEDKDLRLNILKEYAKMYDRKIRNKQYTSLDILVKKLHTKEELFQVISFMRNSSYMHMNKDHFIEIIENNQNCNNESITKLLIESALLLNESLFINDKGEKVPKKCNKCSSKVGVFLCGEPVYKCTNKKCNTYYGVVKFR